MSEKINNASFEQILSQIPQVYAEHIVSSLKLDLKVKTNKYIEQEIKGYLYSMEQEFETKPDRLAVKLAAQGNTYLLEWLKRNAAAKDVMLDYNMIIEAATYKGHINVIIWAISQYAEIFNIKVPKNSDEIYNKVIPEILNAGGDLDVLKIAKVAAASEHVYILDSLYNIIDKSDLPSVAEVAAVFGRYRSIKWLLDKKVNNQEIAKAAISGAASSGRDRLIDFIKSLGYSVDYEEVAIKAASTGHVLTVKNAFKNGAKNYNDVAINAALTAHGKVIEIALDAGANNMLDILDILFQKRQYDLIVRIVKNRNLSNIEIKMLENLPVYLVSQLKYNNLKGNENTDADLLEWFESIMPMWQIFPEKLAYKLAAHGNTYALSKLSHIANVQMNYSVIALIALKTGHYDVYLMLKDAGVHLEHSLLLNAIVESGRTALLQYLSSDINNKNVYSLAITAGEHGRRDVYDWLKQNISNDVDKDKLLNSLLKGAAISGRIALIDKICSDTKCKINYQKIANIGAYNGYYAIIKLAEEKSNNLDHNSIAIAAASAGNQNIVKLEMKNNNIDLVEVMNVLAKRYNFTQILEILS